MTTTATGNAEQYGDSRKLAARARLITHHTVAEQPWFAWLAERLPLSSGSAVLDIGCGPGWFWANEAGRMPADLRLTLADLSAGMVAEAVERCRPLAYAAVDGKVADAVALPFDDASFDAVIAMHMLYHVPEPARAIAEARRVLKPGGFLAVTTNGIGDTREVYALTTLFGGSPVNPAAAAFGFDDAERLMGEAFGTVTSAVHPARLRITDPEDLILAMTSFPPGDRAGADELAAFRAAVEAAFAKGGGVLESEKQTGLFLSRKA